MEELVVISTRQLQILIVDCVNACLDVKLDQLKVPIEPIEFITRQDVADIFGVSLTTVHAWIKAGILTPYKIANKTRFKRAEVMASAKATKEAKERR